MVRQAVFAACCLFALCVESFGQVALEHKFVEDSSYTSEATNKIEQKLTIAGMDVDTSGDTRTTSKVTVGKREADGKLRVQDKVEAMTAAMTVT